MYFWGKREDMSTPKVVSYDGLTLNLATLRAIRVDFDPEEVLFHLIFEHKTRVSYVPLPQSRSYEKQEFQEETRVTFHTEEKLNYHLREWQEMWQNYLNESFEM